MDWFSKLPNGIFKCPDGHYLVSIYSRDLKKTQFIGKYGTSFSARLALAAFKNKHEITYIQKIYTTY